MPSSHVAEGGIGPAARPVGGEATSEPLDDRRALGIEGGLIAADEQLPRRRRQLGLGQDPLLPIADGQGVIDQAFPDEDVGHGVGARGQILEMEPEARIVVHADILASRSYVAEGRIVYTYGPAARPEGVLTGYVNEAGGFVVEHVIVFPCAPPWTLLKLLRAGLAEAWRRDYPYVLCHIPADFPLRRGLVAAGRRLGFTEYATAYWVAYRP